jgi:hypothetical protein
MPIALAEVRRANGEKEAVEVIHADLPRSTPGNGNFAAMRLAMGELQLSKVLSAPLCDNRARSRTVSFDRSSRNPAAKPAAPAVAFRAPTARIGR